MSAGGDPCPFVSRGGLKLHHALDEFGLKVAGLTCADLGCSTGGFTDCLVKAGAERVYSVDTAYGQLAWTLRKDPRVVVLERSNALHVEAPERVDLVVLDLGWTPQRLAIPAALRWLKDGADGRIISLIKPHYEASDRGGSVEFGDVDPHQLRRSDTPSVRLAEPRLTPPPHAGEEGPSAATSGNSHASTPGASTDASHAAGGARERSPRGRGSARRGRGPSPRDHGVLPEAEAHRITDRVVASLPTLGVEVLGVTRSPILGGAGGRGKSASTGNAEWLVLLRRRAD